MKVETKRDSTGPILTSIPMGQDCFLGQMLLQSWGYKPRAELGPTSYVR